MSDLTFDRNPEKWDSVSKTAAKILEAKDVTNHRVGMKPDKRSVGDIMSDIGGRIMKGLKQTYKKENTEKKKVEKSQGSKAREVFGKDTMGFFSKDYKAGKESIKPSRSDRDSYTGKRTYRQRKEKEAPVTSPHNVGRERSRQVLAGASQTMGHIDHLHHAMNPKATAHVKNANLSANWAAREKQRSQDQRDYYGKNTTSGPKEKLSRGESGWRKTPMLRREESLNEFQDTSKHKKKKKDKNWMQHLHIKKGALTAQANKAGEGVQQFAHQHAHDSGTTGKRARLALVFAKARHKKKKHH